MARGGNGNNKQQVSLEDDFDDFMVFGSEEPAGPDFHLPAAGFVHEAQQFEDQYSVDKAVALALLHGANGDFKRTWDFYHPASPRLVPAPDTVMPGMSKAGKELYETAAAGHTIAIFGDYDPDGTTGVEALRRAVVDYTTRDDQIIIRHAKGGRFGLTNEFVKYAHDQDAKLLITVDCGSADVAQVRYAQSLGMRVIVVDHHLAEEDLKNPDKNNPAEHHLNPQLTGTSELTGSPLAWHLGRAMHAARPRGPEDKTVPEEYYAVPMFLAGFGLQADRGRLDTPEHRALIWSPQLRNGEQVVPIGMVVLAEMLADDPVINSEDIVSDPNNRVIMSAAMNASKRYEDASADEVGRMLSARTRRDAQKPAKRILEDYKKVKIATQQMQDEIVYPELRRQVAEDQERIDAQTARREKAAKAVSAAKGAVTKAGDDEAKRAKAEARLEKAQAALAEVMAEKVERPRFLYSALVNDERFVKFRGCAGLMAPRGVSETGGATLVGVTGSFDEATGEPLVKFRMNVPPAIETEAKKEVEENKRKKANAQSRQRMLPGTLRKDEALRALCTFDEYDETGELVDVTSLGGHPPLLSGACKLSEWENVKGRLEEWADEVSGRNKSNWVVERKDPRHEAYVKARLGKHEVKRLLRIEKQAKQYGPVDWGHGHRPFSVSVSGRIENVYEDENGYQRGRLVLSPTESREVFISRFAKKPLPPEGTEAEFVLDMNGGSRYVLKVWHF